VKIARQEIETRVMQIVAEALDRPLSEVRLESSLIDDLGAESIDFLDLVFRLESAFSMKISEERIWAGSRDLAHASDEAFEAGVRRLREDVPGFRWDRFPRGVSRSDLPRLLTVKSIVDYLDSDLAPAESQDS
jgi:acyl carrier protein